MLYCFRSLSYSCDQCGLTADKVRPLTAKSDETNEEIRNLAAQLSMTAEKAKTRSTNQAQSASGDQTTEPAQVSLCTVVCSVKSPIILSSLVVRQVNINKHVDFRLDL